MPGRSSEIDRAGLGDRVLILAGEDKSAPEIAAMISDESEKEFSKHMVHRYLQKSSLNAAVPTPHLTPTMDDPVVRMLVAAIAGEPDVRDSAGSSYFGLYKLITTNTFTGYKGIARGIKNGQVMRGFKNIALKITNGARIVGDERDAEKIDALMEAINFSQLLQNVVRSTCEMGTCVTGLKSKDDEYMAPYLLPMSYFTLLTDAETTETTDSSDKLIHGDVTQIIFNEGNENQILYKRDDVGLLRIWADDTDLVDIKGRNTYGIYGESMTLGVETPLKSQMNAAFYYDAFIARYGLGRLNINMKMLADMLLEKKITPEAATKSRDDTTAAMQKISANEDLVTMGEEVRMIESGQGFDIVSYLNWRGTQIDRALLQSDVGAGDVGSSWTSAGTAVSAQELVTLQSLRDTLFDTFMAEIIVPRLPDFNLKPKTISIAAEPLSQAPVPYQVLTDWIDRGIISESEARVRGGFSHEKPDEV